MTTALANTAQNTRNWPRYHVRLPVLVCAEGDSSKVSVPGLACEISQRGMALYGGIDLLPGDLMEVQFQNSAKLRISGIVRNRSGFCFGLEFLDTMTSPEAISEVLEPAEAEEAKPSWKAWFGTHRGDVAVGTAGLLLFLTFLTAGSQTAQSSQGNGYQPSLTMSERMLVAMGLAEPPSPPVATGNPTAQVWVDTHTGLYYCPGEELYGRSQDGRFTTQRDAQLDQFEPAARRNCN